MGNIAEFMGSVSEGTNCILIQAGFLLIIVGEGIAVNDTLGSRGYRLSPFSKGFIVRRCINQLATNHHRYCLSLVWALLGREVEGPTGESGVVRSSKLGDRPGNSIRG